MNCQPLTYMCFEFSLNFNEICHDSIWYTRDLLILFEKRANEMRKAIVTSPRGLKTDSSKKNIPGYRSPIFLQSKQTGYSLLFERFTPDEIKEDAIPKNLFASRTFGTDVWGIVMACCFPTNETDITTAALDVFVFDELKRKEFKETLDAKKEIRTITFVTQITNF